MADGVVTSPSRLCSRDGKICCYGDALSTIFLLACFCVLVPTFRYSFFFSYFFPSIPACFIFFVSLRHCCSKKSATLSKYVFFSTCSSCLCRLYPTPSWNYFVVLFVQYLDFSSLLFLGWRFFCCALVPSTLALDMPTLILYRRGVWFSLSHCLRPQNFYLKDKESGRTLGVLLMSLGRKNGLM